jgi:hypothetical protein
MEGQKDRRRESRKEVREARPGYLGMATQSRQKVTRREDHGTAAGTGK